MKKTISMILALVMIITVFAGCGQQAAPTTQNTPAASSAAPSTAPSAEQSKEPEKTTRRNDIIRVGFPAAIASMTWSPLIVTKMLGYFEDEGIDLVMEQSYSSSATKMVAAGQAEFSVPGPHLTSAGIDSGMEIISAFQLYPVDIFGFAVMEDSGLKTIADLKGKKIGAQTVTTKNQIIPILEAAGIDPNSVEIVPVADARVQMLTEGKVDACWTWDGEWQQWKAEGMKISYLSGETVYDSCSNSLIANTAFVKEYPELCERFFRALAKGSYFCYLNPRAAADITLKEWKSIKINLDQAEEIMITAVNFMLGGKEVMEGNTIGIHEQSAWELVMKDYVKMGMVKNAVPMEKAFTNQFIEAANDWDRAEVKADADSYKFE